MTHRAEILRILCGGGWSLQYHEFDQVEDFPKSGVSQLVSDTPDGFPEIGSQENTYWDEKDKFHSDMGGDEGGYFRALVFRGKR